MGQIWDIGLITVRSVYPGHQVHGQHKDIGQCGQVEQNGRPRGPVDLSAPVEEVGNHQQIGVHLVGEKGQYPIEDQEYDDKDVEQPSSKLPEIFYGQSVKKFHNGRYKMRPG